jgi:hypothetical protein
MADQRSAAASLYPHLPSAERAEQPERKVSLGEAMWPDPRTQEAKQPAQSNPRRDALLRNLRETVANLRGGR